MKVFGLISKLRTASLGLLAFVAISCSGGGTSPPPPPPPGIASFTASRTAIDLGETVQLRPNFSNGKGTITPGPGDVVSAQDYPVSPRSTTTYVLTVTNTAAVSTSASVTVASNPRAVVIGGTTTTIFVNRGEQFEASVSGIVNQATTWTVTPGTGATLTTSGGFVATTPGSYTLKAASTEDPATFSTRTVTVLPAETVGGVDIDSNGIRDDVDQLIRANVGSGADRTAMEDVARTLQSIAVSPRQLDGDYALFASLSARTQLSMASATMPTGLDGQVFAQTFNTLDRVNTWMAFLNSIGGQIFPEGGIPVSVGQPGASMVGYASTETSPCAPGYVIAYLNGVLNTPQAATNSMNAIKEMIGTTYNGLPVRYRRYYNPTNGLDDFIEAYKQLESANPALRGRWDVFWWVLGSQRVAPSYMVFVSPIEAALSTAIDTYLRREINQSQPDGLTSIWADDLENSYIEGNKVLVVAHSQGNLFATTLRQKLASRISEASWGVIDIANVSPTPPGVNITIQDDKVVKIARLIEPRIPAATVPSSTPTVEALDYWGHNFLKVYTSPAVTRTLLRDTITHALSNLQTPMTGSNPGLFTVALTWNIPADLDLHVFEPDGTHVYYMAPNGHSGSLDHDDMAGTGPEHYSLSCDPTRIQTGVYRICVNYYRGDSGNSGSMTLRGPGRTFPAHPFSVSTANGSGGDATPTQIFKVKVDRLADGTYVVSEVP